MPPYRGAGTVSSWLLVTQHIGLTSVLLNKGITDGLTSVAPATAQPWCCGGKRGRGESVVKTEEDLLLLVDPGTLSYIHLICNGCSVHTYMNTVVRHVLLLSGKHHRSSYG